MSLVFHNTLSGHKEPFQPLKKGKVGIYVCGITPYDAVHIGHARCYVVFDVIKRILRHEGYQVQHIQNFTDIDDKIIDRAKKEKVPPLDWANRFIDDYFHWMKKLNVEEADLYPRVTTHMSQIQKMISRLVENGMAYPSGGDVFYSVRKFPSYGNLSKRNIDDLDAGARVEVDEKKKDPLDFALWKQSKPGEPTWDSPWGKGRPGWHIECSAMSTDLLGETFDIHGGGQDLIFPHHENEVAQSNGASGNDKGFARFWIHNGFVTINKQKMSKSLGNFFTLKDILGKYDAMAVRYFLLTQHYKSPLNFSDKDLTVAQNTWRQRIVGAAEKLDSFLGAASENGTALPDPLRERKAYVDSFYEALRNDVNTPAALGSLNQFCSGIFQVSDSTAKAIKTLTWEEVKRDLMGMLSILGLKLPAEQRWDPVIQELVENREKARKDRDWKKSDKIRDQLKGKGVLVEDTPQGPKIKRL